MENNTLYSLLEIPQCVVQKLENYKNCREVKNNIDIQRLISDKNYSNNLHEIILNFISEDPDGIKLLWEELNIAAKTYDEYKKKNITLEIFVDTMKFCTRFLNEYNRTYGEYKFVWGWWFPKQLSMREFRIGSLEYEYSEEHSCIFIHIPSDADLSHQAVSKSIKEFRNFCREHYSEWFGLELCCESWMLSPALNDIMKADSNIIRFQKLFSVKETDYDSMAVMDWVFPGYKNISEMLPENTSLQVGMKKYLLDGNKIGWSRGILNEDKIHFE